MELKQSKEVLSNPVFSVYEDEFLVRGKSIKRFTVRHPGAAVFLPVDQDGSLLLVEQFRGPLRERLLEAPAGTLEPGEDPLSCAKREIQEEVRKRAEEWVPLGELYPAPGFCDEHQYLFLARQLSSSVLEGDEDEEIEIKRLSKVELHAAIREGEVCDAKTIAILYQAELRGLL